MAVFAGSAKVIGVKMPLTRRSIHPSTPVVRKRWATLAGFAAATVVVVALLNVRIAVANQAGFAVGSGWTATSTWNGKVGDVVDFGVQFETFPDEPITLESVTFDHPLPAHVHLLHTAVMLLTEEPGRSFADDSSWPPATRGAPFKLHAVAGLTLPPHTVGTLIYAVRLDAPGTYVLGPITLHGFTPLVPGVGIGSVPISGTYREYGVLCYSGQQDCDLARQLLPV